MSQVITAKDATKVHCEVYGRDAQQQNGTPVRYYKDSIDIENDGV